MRLAGKILYAAAVIAMLAGLIYYADPGRVAATLAQADAAYVIAGAGVGMLSLALRVKKWAVLLEKNFRQVLHTQLTGVMISNFTPGKIAEPVKAFILKGTEKTDVSASLPSIMWERVVDLVVVIMLSISVFIWLPLGGNFRVLSYLGVLAFASISAAAIAVMYSQRTGRKIFRIARKFPVLKRIKEGFMDSFYSVRVKKRNVAKCFGWTLGAWLLDSIIFYIAFLALGIEPPPFLLLAGIISLSIIIAIASTLPGGIGSFEIVATVLLGMTGISSAVAVPAVFLMRILTLWLSVAIGLVSMAYLGRKIDIFSVMKGAKI